MTREEAITIMQVYKEELEHRIAKIDYDVGAIDLYSIQVEAYDMAIEALSAEAGWIPCSERLPKELEAVNVTWVNHNPPVYYQYTKDVPNADTAVYYRGAWYWWDATVIDLLGEYDGAYVHGIEPIDKDIEVTAWMPLPTPYKGGEDE